MERGTLIKWNDGRGYGFIKPGDGGPDVFVHISRFPGKGRRPGVGDEVFYEVEEGTSRPKAATAKLSGLTPEQQSVFSFTITGMCLGVFLADLLEMIWLPLPLSVYLFMSLLTFAFYWTDKRRAETAQWRVTETPLHTLEILGGWPGALLAQHARRHKTLK